MDRPEPLVVVCCTDANYVRPLAAMVRSLLAHKDPAFPLTLYIFDGGVPEEDKRRLAASWPPEGLEIHWLPLDSAALSGLPLWGVWPPITYADLLMGEALPESLHKAIWLDTEMIVLADIGKLWNAGLDDLPLLAVQDLAIPYVSSRYGLARYRELGLAADAKYFNTGVMVVNLDWWRKNQVARKVLEYLRDHRESVHLLDQDGLNAVLGGRWGALDSRWNQIASIAGRRFLKVTHLDAAQYRQVVDDPWIIHYAGFWKPWRYHNRNPSRALYFHYLDMTAWSGWRPRRTPGSLLLGFYESTLRDWLYPLEHWRVRWLRRLRRRS
jgi:lipopolysaccharide biosynthesis glycosyltransferase